MGFEMWRNGLHTGLSSRTGFSIPSSVCSSPRFGFAPVNGGYELGTIEGEYDKQITASAYLGVAAKRSLIEETKKRRTKGK